MVRAQQYTVNMVSGERDDGSVDRVSTRCYKIQKFLSSVYHFLSSHLGLVIVLLIYSFIGAAIFQAIETPNELERMETREVNIEKGAELLVNWTREASLLPDDQIKQFFADKVQEYEDEIAAFVANSTGNIPHYRHWDFWGSLFFCATVFTTIGYGHIAPATYFGRVACIIYALIGIPLCLVALANLGRLLTKGLKFIWSFIRRFYYTGHCRKIRKSMPRRAMAFRHSIEDKLDMRANRPDSIVHPHQPIWIRFRSRVRRTGRRLWHFLWNYITCQKTTDKANVEQGSPNPTGQSENINNDNQHTDRPVCNNSDPGVESEEDENDRRSVMGEFLVDDEFNLPPLVAIVIVFMYNLFGAAMYTIWETWSFNDSFYFIFISVSTIGFGDVLPDHPKYFLASSVYIIIGLSLVAMVINVIMVAVHDAIRKAKDKALDTIDKARDHLEDQFDQMKDTLDKAKDKVKDVGFKVKEGLSFSMDSLDRIGGEDKDKDSYTKRKMSADADGKRKLSCDSNMKCKISVDTVM